MRENDQKLHLLNKISSEPLEKEEIDEIIKSCPYILSSRVDIWGGSLLLHAVCSRQPGNTQLIKHLVDEGLKYNVGKCQKARGGLIVRDYFDRTPLNILVDKNAISTLRQLQQMDPPLVIPYDVLDSRLFNSVHSTYHVDMVRYLIQLNPRCISEVEIIYGNNYLINYMCKTILDGRFLLRVLPIFIEEGLQQGVGGEYGIGGLFSSHETVEVPADTLVANKGHSWRILAPVIRVAVMHTPILHGAILRAAEHPSLLKYSHIRGLCEHMTNCASIRDSQGRLAIHIAAIKGIPWRVMKDIVQVNVESVKENDPVSGFPIYALAASGEDPSLCSIYELISMSVEDFA